MAAPVKYMCRWKHKSSGKYAEFISPAVNKSDNGNRLIVYCAWDDGNNVCAMNEMEFYTKFEPAPEEE